MIKMLLIAAVSSLFFIGDINAQGRKRIRNGYWQHQMVPQQIEVQKANNVWAEKHECADAMKEVNDKRIKLGLKPLINDPLLAKGALEAARQRAKLGLAGHLQNDFACLPEGASATTAGCAALEESWGWQSCAWDSPQYTVGGAAYVMVNGVRYMHIFLR